MQKVNIVEPSMLMQRAGRNLIQGLKNLPLVHGYDNLQSLSINIPKSVREHDLVNASYVLGEIPSLKDRIIIVRQLWNLTQDVLKLRKAQKKLNESSKDLVSTKNGAFIVAPCPHDGLCPLQKSGKYCHFVQCLQRTSTQRAYKHSKGKPLRGFEDNKFSFVVFRRGRRPREPWPLDGIKFDTLKEQRARNNLEDLDYESQTEEYQSQDVPEEEEWDPVNYDSDAIEINTEDDDDKDEGRDEDRESGNEEKVHADLGGGWGRIIFSPVRRGRQVSLNVCRSVSPESSEASFEHIVVTKNKNPALHRQARKSHWGDLWPF